VFDMMNSVEAAAFYNQDSFIDYNALLKQNYTTIVKACVVDIKKDFYEVVTPKAPVEVSCKLKRVGNTSFTTVVELYCGGKMKPSVALRNVHTIINMHSNTVEAIPEWWIKRFHTGENSSAEKHQFITPAKKPLETFSNVFTVPLSDTDITHKTRCASYFRYFLENASIASHRGYYRNIQTNFHEFHIKKLQMLYLQPSNWGDGLVSESWEDAKNPLTLHCQISSQNGLVPIWYGMMDLFSEVYGLGIYK
jgi:acyl-CoA thioesterase FadM